MEFFANDQDEAEQGVRMPMSEMSTSRLPSIAQTSTTPHQTVVPSSEGTEESLSGAGTSIQHTATMEERTPDHPQTRYLDASLTK